MRPWATSVWGLKLHCSCNSLCIASAWSWILTHTAYHVASTSSAYHWVCSLVATGHCSLGPETGQANHMFAMARICANSVVGLAAWLSLWLNILHQAMSTNIKDSWGVAQRLVRCCSVDWFLYVLFERPLIPVAKTRSILKAKTNVPHSRSQDHPAFSTRKVNHSSVAASVSCYEVESECFVLWNWKLLGHFADRPIIQVLPFSFFFPFLFDHWHNQSLN
jgi:hypothetical protein